MLGLKVIIVGKRGPADERETICTPVSKNYRFKIRRTLNLSYDCISRYEPVCVYRDVSEYGLTRIGIIVIKRRWLWDRRILIMGTRNGNRYIWRGGLYIDTAPDICYDGVMTWIRLPYYRSFARRIHRWPGDSSHMGPEIYCFLCRWHE